MSDPTFPTLPLSGAQGRATIIQSGILRWHLSIEEYVRLKEPYRRTTVKHIPWPVKLAPARQRDIRLGVAWKPRVLEILNKHNMPAPEFLEYRVEKVARPDYYCEGGSYTSPPCLRLLFWHAPHVPNTLDDAVDELFYFLQIQRTYIPFGAGPQHVEILFADKICQPTFTFIDEKCPTAIAYQTAENGIRSVLTQMLGNRLEILDLYNVNFEGLEFVPVICVSIKPFTQANWTNLAEQILSELSEVNGASASIKVEFFAGVNSMYYYGAPGTIDMSEL